MKKGSKASSTEGVEIFITTGKEPERQVEEILGLKIFPSSLQEKGGYLVEASVS